MKQKKMIRQAKETQDNVEMYREGRKNHGLKFMMRYWIDKSEITNLSLLFVPEQTKYTYVRKVFHHLDQNGFTAASNLVRPAKRYSLEPYLIILKALIWWENISRYRLTNFENLRYEFLLLAMTTVSKKIISRTQELPNKERLAVK